ncbi:TlpA family protein disulfide reductase [Pokkaliibacter sp. CJK22405]|uniref:TlpA family protein disulfide reductase n=1 Tax=Pokkaliibacter sp. CJK22405 TaxID=3384615 RepID=UPI003984A5D7
MKTLPALTALFRASRKYWLIPLTVMSLSVPVHADENWDAAGENLASTVRADLVGQPAPPAVLKTIDGDTIDLSSLYGKTPVYLKFWATWCIPCRQQMPGFEKIYDEMGDQIKVIAVDTGFADDIDAVRSYRKKHQLKMPIVMDDGSLGAALKLRVTPQHVVIDRRGIITHIGHLDDEKLHLALKSAIAEQAGPAVAPQTTQANTTYGVGDQVSDLALKRLDGTPVNLAQSASGQPQALVFFAPWCEWYLEHSRPETSKACKRVLGQTEELMKQGGVEWLGISSGLWVTAADLQDYQKTSNRHLPLALDTDDAVFRAFGIRDMPSVVLLDAKGRVRRILGPKDTTLKQAIQALRTPAQ